MSVRTIRGAIAWAGLAASVVVASGTVPHDGMAPFGGALRDLTASVGPCRLTPGRLPGGFPYAPTATMRCDPGPDARARAGAVLKVSATTGAPAARLAVAEGTAHLVFHDADAAIARLEPLARARPTAPLLTMLSAVYLESDRSTSSAESAARATDAAERALWIEPGQIEARFNRAVGLERLGFIAAARAAWDDYLARDRTSRWSDEARQHRRSLATDGPRWDDLLRDATGSSDAQAESRRQLAMLFADRCRRRIEDDLLREWAMATVNHEAADRSFDEATALAAALYDAHGDRTYLDLLERMARVVDPESRQRLARGVLAGIRAASDALADLTEAHRTFLAHHLPTDELDLYALFADYYRAHYTEAIGGLRQLGARAAAESHLYVAARASLVLAAVAVRQARPTDAEIYLDEASGRFARAGETGYLASTHAIASNRHRDRGDATGAWVELGQALRLLDRVDEPQHAYPVLHAANVAAAEGRLSALADDFSTALIRTAEQWRNPVVLATTLADQARQLADTPEGTRALEVVSRARAVLPQVADDNVRAVTDADVARAEAMVRLKRQPCDAAPLYAGAIDTLSLISPNRLPAVFLERGRAWRACGRLAEAEIDFRAGIRAFEEQRSGQRGEPLRISMFDEAWDLYAELIRLLAIDRADHDGALVIAEQARARALDESIGVTTPRDAIDIRRLQQTLDPNAMVVEYAVLGDDIVAWPITRSAVGFMRLAGRSADVARLVNRWRQLVIDGRDERLVSRELYDVLLQPIARAIRRNGQLIVSADGALHGLSFAALWDGQAYLVERCAVWSVPSLTAMAWADAELARRRVLPPTLLAVGDPALSARRFPRLTRLAYAAREALAVTHFYPHHATLIGADASRPRVLAATKIADIIHIAAHAVANPVSPVDSYIVTAADPDRDNDLITASDLAALGPLAARLVVLSACQTGSGRTARGEGVLSLARAVLAAGVPTVISNLWDASDADSYELFVALHRELTNGRSAAEALRHVQLQYVRGASTVLRLPRAWAGVVGVGASGPLIVSR